MNSHLKRVLILLLIFTFVFQMAGVTSLSRVQAYADTETEETLVVSDADEAEDVTTEEIDTESPGEIETDGENPPDAAEEEPVDPETASEETAEVPEETPAGEETVTIEEPAEQTLPVVEETVEVKAEAKAAGTAKSVTDDPSKTVLAFSSDVHNCYKSGTTRPDDNMSATRLGNWIDAVENDLKDVIDVMAFGGDMANASASETDFWTLTQNDLDMLEDKGVEAILTTGNHEHSPGKYSATSTNGTQQVYQISTEAKVGNDYRIYCLGSESSSSTYSSSQISALTKYLNGAGNDKPIFIITHFPLHYTSKGGGRSTTGASDVIDALNTAVENNGQTIVFLWGHNHTVSDTYYDQIYGPGGEDSIQYASGSSDTKTIKFYYGAAGCMSDSEYGTGSNYVQGKGLVVTITKNRGNATMGFTYYDANAEPVTESASVKSADITVRSTTSYVQADTLEDGKNYLIANGVTGDVYFVSNETTGSGNSAGLKGIAASVTDGKITLSEEDAAKAAFTAEIKTSDSGSISAWLKQGDSYLYTASSNGLRISNEQTGSGNTGKFWHYSADDKLLWFFKDTSSSDGLTDSSGTYKYWLEYSGTDSVTFTSNHTTGANEKPRISDFDTPDIYLFVESNGESVPVTGVTLDKSTDTVEVGKTTKLTATVAPGNATNKGVTWSTSDSNVATVSGGTVTGVGAGTATITVTTKDGGYTANCTITVPEPVVYRYEKVNSIKAGGEYIIANVGTGEGYALTNDNGTVKATAVTVSGDAIETANTNIVFVAQGSGTSVTDFENNGRYINVSNSSTPLSFVTSARNLPWTYNGETHRLSSTRSSSSSTAYYIRYSSRGSNFSASSSSQGDIYIYEKVEQGTDPVSGVTLNKSTLNLNVGDSETLTATVEPSTAIDKTVTWSSSDTAVATVDNGVVTAVAAGTATITATSNGDNTKTATCEVTVTAPVLERYELATTLEADGEYLIVSANSGSAYALKNPGTSGTNIANSSYKTPVSIKSGSPNYIEIADTDIVWKAEASGSGFHLRNGGLYLEGSSGNTSVFSALNNSDRAWTYSSANQLQMPGSTNYTYTIRYNSSSNYFQGSSSTSSNTYTVYLFKKFVQGTDPVSSVTLNKNTLDLSVGDAETLTATVEPATAVDKTVTWSSSNTAVATVANGVVTAVGAGTATITATSNGDNTKTATCAVTVTAPVMVTYFLTDTFEEGGEYIIANGKTGSVYVVSDTSTGSGTSTGLVGISANVVNDSITLSASDAAKATFTAEMKTSQSGAVSAWLKHNGKYLYTASSGGLRISDEQTTNSGSTNNTGKFWHYKADGKDLLWYFKDTSSSDGYTDTSSTYRYYLDVSSGNFISKNVGNGSSLANTTTPAIYLFVKDDGSTKYNVTLPEGFDGASTVKEGKAYTFTKSADADDYEYGDVTYTMGGGASTPITPDESGVYTIANVTGDLVISGTRTPKPATTYVLTDTLQAGDKFIIASTDTAGAAKLLYNDNATANSANVTVVEADGKKTITTSKASAVLTATANDDGFTFKNGDYFLTLEYKQGGTNNSELRFSTDESTKKWLYSGYQLTCSSSQSPRYLYYSDSNTAFVANTSGNGRYAYVYVEQTDTPHEHTYGTPAYEWATDNSKCTATVTCSECGDVVTEEVTPVYAETAAPTCTEKGSGTYTATFTNSLFTVQTNDVEVPSKGHTIEHHDAVPATCSAEGTVEYYSCSVCGKNFSDAAGNTEIGNIVDPKKEHTPVTDAAVEATCTDTGLTEGSHCSVCNTTLVEQTVIPKKDHTPGTAVHENEVAATCTAAGSYDEVVYCTVCNTEISRIAKATPATGHAYGEPTYEWTADNNSVTAKRVCANDPAHVETETVDTDYTIVTPATETTAGTGRYTATFTNPAFGTQTNDVTIQPTGYTVEYAWNKVGNGYEVTGTATPIAQGAATITETVTATYAVTTEPTCTEKGVGTYTATFTKSQFSTQTKVVEVSAKGHNMTHVDAVPSTCTAEGTVEHYTCSVCEKNFSDEAGTTELTTIVEPKKAHTPGTATHENEVAATCTTAGSYDEVVKCTVCGTEISRTTVTVQATGHDWNDPTYVWSDDNKTVTATRTCNNADHPETQTVNTAYVVVTAATETEAGLGRYTATFTNPAFATQTKEVPIPATGFQISYVWAEDNSSVTGTAVPYDTAAQTITETVTATYEVTTAATCTAEGTGTWTAAFTKAPLTTQTKVVAIPKAAHTLTATAAKASTCLEAGNSAYWTCSVCHKYFSDAEGKTEIAENSWVLPLGSHNLTATAAKAATCTEAGNTAYYTCSVCHKYFSDAEGTDEIQADSWVIAAKGHNWGAPTYEWAADNSTVKATRVCGNDPAHTETETATTTSTTTAATCTAAGSTTYTATFNNSAFAAQNKTVEIPATGHTMTHHAAVPATCTDAGTVEYYSCSVCNKNFSDEAGRTELTTIVDPAKGHTGGTATRENVVAATCETEGSYDEVVKCTVCGAEISRIHETTPALGHNWSEPVYVWADDYSSVTATRTCQRDTTHFETETAQRATYGVITPATEIAAGVGRYTSAAFRNTAFTVQYIDVEIPPTGYEVSYKWADDNSSVTGTAKPYDTTGQTITETVAATYEETTAATCTTTGVGTWTSAAFTNSHFTVQKKTVDIPAKGHSLRHHAAAEPSCGVAGNTEYWQCENCGTIFGDEAGTQVKTASEVVIPALSHNYEAEVTKQPTCEETGVRSYTCSLCGDTYTEVIPANGHDWGEVQYTWASDNSKVTAKRTCATDPTHVETETVETTCEVLKQVTCEEDGKELYTSAAFKNEDFEVQKMEVVVSATGHKAGDPVHENEKAATCTSGGYYDEVVYCTECGKELSRVNHTVDALGHDFSEWTVIHEATCTEKGEEESTCSRCTAKNTRELPALGHSWDGGKVTKEPTYRTDGEMTYTCKTCGETYTEVIPKQGWKRDSNNNWNYIEPDGSKATGWKKVGDYWYYMDAAGIMQTGWTKVGNKWYYMNKNGAMQTGWQKISGKWYYFNKSGAMLTGWQDIGGKTYYFKSSGVMADKEWVTGYWWINAGGTWTYKYRASWEKTSDGHWMFKATNGWTAKNTTIIINDVSYTFDANGWMQ